MFKSIAKQLSNTTSTILITGESGTDKELFAQAIHNNSDWDSGPFVRINCAALPENLLESELFGYKEGAFTGAQKGGKPGEFELAKEGTSPISIKVRGIAATNRDLEEMIAKKDFREDLYYRLNVVRLNILPLREQMEGLPLLVEHIMARINNKLKIDSTAKSLLLSLVGETSVSPELRMAILQHLQRKLKHPLQII